MSLPMPRSSDSDENAWVDQVDGALFEIVPIHKTPVAEWLDTVAGQGMRIGYDPWLHGKAEIDKLPVSSGAFFGLDDIVTCVGTTYCPSPFALTRRSR